MTKTPAGKASQVGFSALYPKANLNDPAVFEQSVQNVVNVHDLTRQHFPEEYEQGKVWYERVHEGVSGGIRRTSLSRRHEAGSGIIAVTSAGSDFEARNQPAIKATMRLKAKDWDVINEAHRQGGKTPEMAALLRGTPLESVTAENLVRAHRIIEGEHPTEVINPRTSPKEHAFYHAIEYPDQPGMTTIDFRAHDIGINRMYPAAFTGRGISSAALPSGQRTRYELFSDVYQAAAHARDMEAPHPMQAITWVGGKKIETLPPLKSGGVRTKGVQRHGQPYFHPEEGRSRARRR